ncbi:ATP-binding protein [Paenibacillus sp. LHD-117]|uniref:ATP-binding protein n=1 Tax=Paenibacillus sp. LHD-117 TaxID=3071412 RepID=UPI0027E096A6|nr:ATP-binding protein [Paenibacillus sp. LHD-117]MDQ6422317.1 ATP-binding protein [Paenibacillus sp. LHD-117]
MKRDWLHGFGAEQRLIFKVRGNAQDAGEAREMAATEATLVGYGGAEHLRDEFIWLDAGLRTLLDLGGDDPFADPLAAFKGLVIDKTELVEEDAAATAESYDRAWQAYTAFRRETEERIGERARRNDGLPLVRLAAAFRLTVWEYRCVLLCLAVEWDRKYEKWYAYLNDDATARTATVDLALRLLGDAEEDRQLGRGLLGQGGMLRRWLLQYPGDGSAAQGLKSTLRLDERVISFLLETERLDGRLSGYAEVREPDEAPGLAWEGAAEAEYSLRHVIGDWPTGSLPVAGLWGARGGGKRTLLHRLAARRGQRLLIVSLAALPSEEERLRGVLGRVVREALLTDAAIAFAEEDGAWKERLPLEPLRSSLEAYASHAQRPLLGWSSPDQRTIVELPLPGHAAYWSIEIPPPSAAVRAELWRRHAEELGEAALSPDGIDYESLAAELADRFHFTPGQIASAWRQARVLAAGRGEALPRRVDLAAAARGQFRHRLAQHAVAIEPRRGWADLILPAESMELIREACNRYVFRETVLGEWGFSSRLSYGIGVHMLFAGPPGTGKTMAAEVVAGELGLELYRVDLSRIVSKYIGETEQRLRELFEEARQSGAILFFDEGDALFGKRTEVKDAHDRYANMEAAYLLQLIEAYDGVTILATNLMQNLDEALLRRMSVIVKFPFPDSENRARIFDSLLPAGAPLDEELDIPFLAQRVDVSGGHIKNIVLAAAFLAAGERRSIGMAHMIRAARAELQKLGKIPMRGSFAPYSD